MNINKKAPRFIDQRIPVALGIFLLGRFEDHAPR